MPRFAATYEVHKEPEVVYAILTDVERMAEFMPLCKRSRVLSREVTGDGEVLLANFLLRYRQIEFERSVDLRFTLWPGQRRMLVEEPQGNFGSGASQVRVDSHGRGRSRVMLESDYRIAHPVVRWTFGKRLMAHACNRIMDRVRQRAETLDWS